MSVSDDVLSLIIGIIGSLLSLWLLFSIKPSLRLTWEEGFHKEKRWRRSPSVSVFPDGTRKREWWSCSEEETSRGEHPKSGARCPECQKAVEADLLAGVQKVDRCLPGRVHYRVEVENLGLGKVVEVRARLWRMTDSALARREEITMKAGELLELNGKWQDARRTAKTEDRYFHFVNLNGKWQNARRTGTRGDRFFHFVIPCEVPRTPLDSTDSFLFQVWSRHGFTNFGRVHKLRITRNSCDPELPFARFTAEDPDAGRWRSRLYDSLTTQIAIASVAIRKHIDRAGRRAKLITSTVLGKHAHQFRQVNEYPITLDGSQRTVAVLRCDCQALYVQFSDEPMPSGFPAVLTAASRAT